jgi:choline dehydrogenase
LKTFLLNSGGSSGMNAILYVCGNDRDYDSWAQQGNVGWNYRTFLHYIKKSEDNTNQEVLGDGKLHGRGGFLTVSDYEITDPFVSVIRKAFGEIGYKQIKDYRKGNYVGIVELQGTIRGNERCSASRAFLQPIRDRKNLFVMKQSLVTKVLFSGSKAIGVNVRTTNPSCRDIKMYVSKEVIVSAGALGSPKILLQSGIGKFEDLRQFNIPQIKNLPVGENLQDHVESVNFIKVNPKAFPRDMINDLQKYFFQRTGIFSNLGTTNHNGFVNTKNFHAKYPDIQYLFVHFPKAEPFLSSVLANAGFKDEFIAELLRTNQNYEILMTYTVLLNPKSRGSVKLKSRDPTAPPKIISGYLTHPDDVDTLVRGINKLQTLINTPAMRANFAENIKFNIPECNSIPFPSDNYWRCYLKYFTASLWHPSGSCKMGNSSDRNAVVDDELRVYGIKNLRVADASIMPNIPSGNTQCPGEKNEN